MSPKDVLATPRRGVKIDPKLLTENLADFFEDIADGGNGLVLSPLDDDVVDRLSKTVDSIPITMGASKEEETEEKKDLKFEAYPCPEK